MKLRVQNFVSPLGVLHPFLCFDELGLVPVGVVLHLLYRVSLSIEIYQFPPSLVNLFLQMLRKREQVITIFTQYRLNGTAVDKQTEIRLLLAFFSRLGI